MYYVFSKDDDGRKIRFSADHFNKVVSYANVAEDRRSLLIIEADEGYDPNGNDVREMTWVFHEGDWWSEDDMIPVWEAENEKYWEERRAQERIEWLNHPVIRTLTAAGVDVDPELEITQGNLGNEIFPEGKGRCFSGGCIVKCIDRLDVASDGEVEKEPQPSGEFSRVRIHGGTFALITRYRTSMSDRGVIISGPNCKGKTLFLLVEPQLVDMSALALVAALRK